MKEMNYNRFNYKSYKSRIKCPIFVNRGAHQITKTAPKPFVKWYNRTTPQVIVHHTAWCNVVCSFIIKKLHKLHRTIPSLYINIFIYF